MNPKVQARRAGSRLSGVVAMLTAPLSRVVTVMEPAVGRSSAPSLAWLLRQLADDDRRCVIIVSHDDRLREIADRVLWLEDGTFRQLSTLAIDPVCHMQVEPTGPQETWRGQQWWFCSDACRREFLTEPERFATGR